VAGAANPGKLSREAFDLLLRALDPDRQQAGEKYERLRRKLVKFFLWESLASADELADEAVDRVARRLAGGEQIADLDGYFWRVCRFLVIETRTRDRRHEALLRRMPQPHSETESDSQAMTCLETCLARLPEESRAFLLRYYQHDRGARIAHRRALAAEFGLSINALRNRALRLRERVEACVGRCLGDVSPVFFTPKQEDE